MTTLQTPLTLVTPNVTASATLAAGKHTPVDATSGALTMTLPTPATVGARLRVEKVDASSNAVTISGTIRGGVSTIGLAWQFESIELVAESLTSWRPSAGHKTKASLDAAYETKGAAAAATTATALDAATATNVISGATTAPALKAAFVAYAPAPTGVGATDDANVRAAITAVVAAGGGTVRLRAGGYRLLTPIAPQSGVAVEGVRPVTKQSTVNSPSWLADGEFTFTGGSYFIGDGTFSAFEANAVDQGAAATNQGDLSINNFAIRNVGFDTFTNAVHVGANNIMGLTYSELDGLFIRNCSQWGVNLTNFAHVKFGRIVTTQCTNGQRYAAALPATTFIPGNSVFEDLFHLLRASLTGRGIVFEASTTGASLNQLVGQRIQCNVFNRTQLSVAAGVTSGSTAVTVPDGTQFAVGMPVTFTTTANGYTTSVTYVVLSIATNTLTLALQKSGTAISASGTGSMTLTSWGMPCVEIAGSASGASVQSSHFGQLDTEGGSQAGLYLENVITSDLRLMSVPGTNGTNIVGRSFTNSEIRCTAQASTDFDGNSSTSAYHGTKGTTIQRTLRGIWRDSVLNANVFELNGGASGSVGDLQVRANGFLYPGGGIGERISPVNSSITLSGSSMGDVIYAGSSAITLTLPTILTDSSNVGASQVGAWFDIWNVGSSTITVNTDGTQLINKVAGRTTTTVAAGGGLKIVAARDAGGGLFWAAKSTTLVA